MPRGLSLRLVQLVKVRKMKEAMFKNAKGVVTKVSTVSKGSEDEGSHV